MGASRFRRVESKDRFPGSSTDIATALIPVSSRTAGSATPELLLLCQPGIRSCLPDPAQIIKHAGMVWPFGIVEFHDLITREFRAEGAALNAVPAVADDEFTILQAGGTATRAGALFRIDRDG